VISAPAANSGRITSHSEVILSQKSAPGKLRPAYLILLGRLVGLQDTGFIGI